MEIISISRHNKILRYISICRFCRRSHLNHFSKEFSLLDSFLSPHTCIEISSLLLKEVVRYLAELKTCSTSKENNSISFRDVEQFLEKRYSLINNRLEIFSSVADFHQRESRTIKIQTSISRSLNHLTWKDRRSGIEIVLFHFI